ncbi:MAG: hypothetical protein BGO01_04415 [Armatimonadetes bacterium 55-13]|nr:PEP-CTERM sorting domain-containing protein [Armatimonadota bacterium]OJU63390.1 MAG: hypothetical protein BGO01_04415 [Armatimonadetes bacterium 55-13]
MKPLPSRILSFMAFASVAAGAQANLIVNGDFETGNTNDWFLNSPGNNSAVWAGFGVGGSNGYVIAEFSGTGGSVLSQDVITVANQNYLFSFDLSDDGFGASGFTASFGDKVVFSEINPDTNGDFKHFSYLVTATSDLSTVKFTGYNNPSITILDNVSLTAAPVPEPASMAALGLGVAAFIRRRKRA